MNSASVGITPGYKPETMAEFKAALKDPLWRLSNLYWITIKGDDGETDLKIKFKPNRAQRRLIKRMWNRNLILKARQLGFTTFVCILYLDASLFGAGNTRAGIIAHTDGDAAIIFRDKVKFAYDNLPESVRQTMPLKRDSARELLFEHNNSSIRVGTSMRSGTIHYLHISEFGKICARYPHRAQEIITGTLPTVPRNGIIFVESTAEGPIGDFYKMSNRAQAHAESGKKLTKKDYRFHFFPWFDAPEYEMDPSGVIITDEDHDYFDEKEAQTGAVITMPKRAWYCATRDGDFNGSQERMWQEFPSTPEEAFQVSAEGTYFAKQITSARKQQRIRDLLPVAEGIPCWTFWDIGNSDGTAIWVIQKVGPEFRCIRFYEAWGEPYSHAVNWLQNLGLNYAMHYLPHDADHVRQGQTSNQSPKQMLEGLIPGASFDVVPKIEDVNWGIQQTRDVFPMLWFDLTHTKKGLEHLEAYRRKWSDQQDTWTATPDKTGGHSEAADALRQFAQAYAGGRINISRPSSKRDAQPNWRVA